MNLKTIYPLLELAATHLLPLLNSSNDIAQLRPPEVEEASHSFMVTIIIETKADSLEEAKSLVTSRLVGIGAKEVEIHEAQSQV